MKTATIVQGFVFGLMTLAAPARQEPALRPQSPQHATWRAIVIDGVPGTALLLDPAASKPVPVGRVVPGDIFEPRDPSRLVFFGSSLNGPTSATILSDSPLRTVGPVSLGAHCDNILRAASQLAGWASARPVVETEDGERIILACPGMLVGFDLRSGAVTTQPAPKRTLLYPLGDERVLAVAAESCPPFTEMGFHDARTLAQAARVQVKAYLRQPALVRDGRELLLIDPGDECAKVPQPLKLRYFDATSGEATRTTSLDAPFKVTRTSEDGRFVYASNMNRNEQKQTPRELRILAADSGEVLEKFELLEHASWFVHRQRHDLPVIIEDRRFRDPASSRLLFLEAARVIAALPIANFVYQLSVDEERGRMYLLDGRSLGEYTWPGLQVQKQVALGNILHWGGQPEDRPSMSVAPGATRALVVAGGSAVAVDLVARAPLPTARLGSSGARTRKFWADFGKLAAAMATYYPGPGRPALLARSPLDPVPIAFSRDGRMAMLPAPTGQITMVDMTTGRAVRHLPGGDAAMAVADVPLVIAADRRSSWVLNVATGETMARFPVAVADADAPLFASVSPDSSLVLIGRGAAVHLLDAATGRTVSEWTGFGRIAAVRFLRAQPASSAR